jgi:hypothetical protein
VSLSWLDRLTLFIHPQRVVLARQPWRGAPSRQAAEVAPPTPGEADWQPVLAAADVLLESAGRGAALRIVIADHLVRYALLPWSDMLTGKAARLEMARALFRNALGERAAGLDIALDRPAFGKSGVAAGIDRQLLAGLRAAARARHLRLRSVQPRLIAELAAQQAALDDGWLACLDDGWLTLAGIRGGELSSLRNHRASTAEPAILASELAGLLAAESATVNGKKVLISTSAASAPKLVGGWEATRVEPVAGGAHA